VECQRVALRPLDSLHEGSYCPSKIGAGVVPWCRIGLMRVALHLLEERHHRPKTNHQSLPQTSRHRRVALVCEQKAQKPLQGRPCSHSLALGGGMD
jgi:hypothetical protein